MSKIAGLIFLTFFALMQFWLVGNLSIQNKNKLSRLSTFKNSTKGAFSPDGKLLALIGRDHVDIVDIRSVQLLVHIAPERATMLGVRFSPNGLALATAHKIIENSQINNFKVSLWDVSTGKEKISLPTTADEWYRTIDDLSFSRDGKLLASNLGGIPRLWKTGDGSEFQRFPPPAGSPDLRSERVLLAPEGERLAVYYKGDKPPIDIVTIWNLPDKKNINLPVNIYRDWEFSADSTLLAVTAIQRKGLPDEHSSVEILAQIITQTDSYR